MDIVINSDLSSLLVCNPFVFTDTTDDAVQKLVATSGGYFDGVIDFTGYESSIERGLSALDQVLD